MTKVEEVDIAAVKPYWRNPRENATAVEKVKESIKNYGYNQYIVVDRDLIIIAGHTRYLALKELGFTKITVIITDLDNQKAKEYRIADNKTNEYAEWNYAYLMNELREVDMDRLQAVFKENLKNIINVGVNTKKDFAMIGGDIFKERESEMRNKFNEDIKAKKTDIVDITCPKCGEVFGVDKKEDIWTQ